MVEWDDDQEEMSRAAKERDNKARAKYEREVAPVRQERAVKREDPEQKILAQEAKARDLKARVLFKDEIKGERLRKAKEFLREEEIKKQRALAAAEKEKIQAQMAKDRMEKTAGQVAEKAKMSKLRADVKMERVALPAAVKEEKSGISAGYRRAIQQRQGDTSMRDRRDPPEVKAEVKLEREVRANKAAIDQQEKEGPQAMEVDKPKGVGGTNWRS